MPDKGNSTARKQRTQGKAFQPPNYTQTPNEYYDELLPQITSLSEMKVTEVIIRQTLGWQRDEKQLSLTLLEKLTGLSRVSVSEGIKLALQRGYVGRRKVNGAYVYGLRVSDASKDSLPIGSKESLPIKRKRTKESYDANASRGITDSPESLPTEKYITDKLYDEVKAKIRKWSQDEYAFHLGRVQYMLEHHEVTDEEIEALPHALVTALAYRSDADVIMALGDIRREKFRVLENQKRARERAERREELKEEYAGPAPWEEAAQQTHDKLTPEEAKQHQDEIMEYMRQAMEKERR